MALRDYILKNFWLKVLSFVLAVLIWGVIQSSLQMEPRLQMNPFRPQDTREFRLPVTVMTSPSNRRVFKIEPTEVNVKVRGETTALARLAPEEVHVYVKLVDVPDPDGSFLVEVNVPRDVTLQDFWPAHVYVQPVKPENN